MTEMSKTRMPKGEKYWWIQVSCYDIVPQSRIESGSFDDDNSYKQGNYFASYEEAESMANKLRAVLKGAEVIDVTTANVGSADELDAKKHQIELILSHRQTIVIAEHKGSLDWRWNTKSIETRNDMLKTVISKNEINFTKEEDLPRYVNYLLAEAKHTTK